MYLFNEKQKIFLEKYCRQKYGCALSDFTLESDSSGYDVFVLPESIATSTQCLCDADNLHYEISDFIDVLKEILIEHNSAQHLFVKNTSKNRQDTSEFLESINFYKKKLSSYFKAYKNTIHSVSAQKLDENIPLAVRSKLTKAVKEYNREVSRMNVEIRKSNKELDSKINHVENLCLKRLKEYLFMPYKLPYDTLEFISNTACLDSILSEETINISQINDLTRRFDELTKLFIDLLELEKEAG